MLPTCIELWTNPWNQFYRQQNMSIWGFGRRLVPVLKDDLQVVTAVRGMIRYMSELVLSEHQVHLTAMMNK